MSTEVRTPAGTPAKTPWWSLPLMLTGGAALAWGLYLLVTGGLGTNVVSSGKWMIGSLVVHDAVLAPATVVVGLAVVRLTRSRPRAVRYWIAGGLFSAAALTVVALPVLLSDGAPSNPTATPRDYGSGLLVLLGVVVAVVVLAVVAVAVRGPRAPAGAVTGAAPDAAPARGRRGR